MYMAIDLSKYIIFKCIKDDYPISNLQLQNILFYIQKDFLNRGKIAFAEDIEAWPFGPAVPDVYYYFCGFGAMPISILNGEYSVNAQDKEVIDNIIEEKRVLNPWESVAEIHKPNGAWNKVYRNGIGNRQVISTDLIRKDEYIKEKREI